MSLECVSCKAQSVYEVSKSSYVYLEGTCQNCHNDSKIGVKSSATLVFGGLKRKGESEREQSGKSCVRNKITDLLSRAFPCPGLCLSVLPKDKPLLGHFEAKPMNDQLFSHKK